MQQPTLPNTQQKIGHRLSVLLAMLQNNNKPNNSYADIWDCCCDHGYLGMSILQAVSDTQTRVHFVDTVAHIITNLHQHLQRHYKDSNWQTHCINAGNINLGSNKQLVIIAGVGGDLTCEIVSTLLNNINQGTNVDLLLCPANRAEVVRDFIVQTNATHQHLYLKTEQLIYENKRFYEALLITTETTPTKPCDIGSVLWQTADTQLHIDYLRRQMASLQLVISGLIKKNQQNTYAYTTATNRMHKYTKMYATKTNNKNL